MIIRSRELDSLLRLRDQPVIKVVTGVRRCGKSTLLEQATDRLMETGVPAERIIRINFEDIDSEPLCEYHALHAHIVSRLVSGHMTYVLLDEIQRVPQFQRAVDSLLLRPGVDLYLTGSNADILSGELATLLSGRYVETKLLPLSLAEYCKATGVDQSEPAALTAAYKSYLLVSSFPYCLRIANDHQAVNDYLMGLFNTILLKDIIARHSVADPMMLESVVRFLLDNVGSPLSTTKVANTMSSGGHKIDQRTVEKYVSALTGAMLFYEARRWDIKGKRALTTQEKYYSVDMGLRFALLGGRGLDVGHTLENVIYLELLRRGYRVLIGQAGRTEVDFVAERGDERHYFQVAATVRGPETEQRELASLASIRDFYPKTVLTLDDDPDRDSNGIQIRNALTWLVQSW